MELTGVAAMSERPVDALSGGELQRVWLATCLAQDTNVLLLDEPTILDLRYQAEILDLMRELADDHGIAVGVVLHDLNQAASVADEVVLMPAGRVLAAGRPHVLTEELLTAAYGRAHRRPGSTCRPVGSGPAGRPAHPPPVACSPSHSTQRNRLVASSSPATVAGAATAVALASRLVAAGCGTTEEPAESAAHRARPRRRPGRQ